MLEPTLLHEVETCKAIIAALVRQLGGEALVTQTDLDHVRGLILREDFDLNIGLTLSVVYPAPASTSRDN